ncbi:MAG: branched-chain amino acid ABC transporter permease [Deltaproteobacteria bacterium]|jgi:branched-chain amino acid transport system permease protein|nr:branched-chain amino acid ABC transporter permease [Deltaproteobacteria bacterium]
MTQNHNNGRNFLSKALTGAIVFVFAFLPLLLNTLAATSAPYWIDVVNTVGLYTILALSLNVILGHAGMFHMGHAAFFAIGAYTTAVLNLTYGWSILATMPVAGLAAGLVALVVAWPIIHLRGDYLLIVTIGIVEIVRIALTNNLFGLTGGSNGLVGIARPSIFGFRITKPQHFYYFIWIVVGLTLLLFHWLENSRFGRALKFIKEDTVAAENMGVNTSRYKLMAFVVGAAWAGLAGTIFACRMRTISPESFVFSESVLLFTIVILGGKGSQKGVLLGSFLVMGLPEFFRGFEDKRLLVFGAALVVMMIFRPQGLLPSKPARYKLPEPWAGKFLNPPNGGLTAGISRNGKVDLKKTNAVFNGSKEGPVPSSGQIDRGTNSDDSSKS